MQHIWRILSLVSHYANEAWGNTEILLASLHSAAVRQTCNLFSFLHERTAILRGDAVARWCGNPARHVSLGLMPRSSHQLTATRRLVLCSLSATFPQFPRRWFWPLYLKVTFKRPRLTGRSFVGLVFNEPILLALRGCVWRRLSKRAICIIQWTRIGVRLSHKHAAFYIVSSVSPRSLGCHALVLMFSVVLPDCLFKSASFWYVEFSKQIFAHNLLNAASFHSDCGCITVFPSQRESSLPVFHFSLPKTCFL